MKLFIKIWIGFGWFAFGLCLLASVVLMGYYTLWYFIGGGMYQPYDTVMKGFLMTVAGVYGCLIAALLVLSKIKVSQTWLK